MKQRLIVLTFFCLLANCGRSQGNTLAEINHDKTRIDWTPARVLSLELAERILGEKGHREEALSFQDGETKSFAESYFANQVDQETQKTGALYYMISEYASEKACHDAYVKIKIANQKGPGLTETKDLGDEGYFQGNSGHFWFMISRVKNELVVMKLNKVTSRSQERAFHEISYEVWR